MTRPPIELDAPLAPDVGIGHPGCKTREFDISVVTPMFGGGAVARETDSQMPIRAQAIRGQLRFWWRATCGSRFDRVESLRKRETEIFGSVDEPSQLMVGVRIASAGTPISFSELKGRHESLAYALFPFQEDGERSEAKGLRDIQFVLNITQPSRCDEEQQRVRELDTAVWAWVNFGGVGSRTRRGCGSLSCDRFSPQHGLVPNIESWLRESSCPRGTGQSKSWPTLGSSIWIHPAASDGHDAWAKAIEAMRGFRQSPDGRSDSGSVPGFPGRSYWPEANSVRVMTGCWDPKYAPVSGMPVNAFPRSEFGLPIQLHFKGGTGKNSPRVGKEPADTTIKPVVTGKVLERMSSPFIVKSLAVASGRAVPMILLLRVPALASIEVDVRRGPPKRLGSRSIRGASLSSYARSPMEPPKPGEPPRSATGSAIEAFLAFAKEKGFREVTR